VQKKSSRPRRQGAVSVIAAAVLPALVPLSARAQTKTWLLGPGTGNWSVAANWTPSGVPANGSTVRIFNTDAGVRTINYNYIASLSLTSLLVDQTGTGTNTLSIPAYWLTATTQDVGKDGRGFVVQTGGSNTATSELRLGYNAGGSGSYALSGGSLSAGNLLVGKNGNATFTQSGGTATVTTDLRINAAYTKTASYALSGTGSLTTKNLTVSGDGASFYTQTGGAANVTGLFWVLSAVGDATATLAGGTLTTDMQSIGSAYSPYGVVNHSAGSNTARIMSVSGTYNLSGSGALSVSGYAAVGMDGDGWFNQTGGSATIPTVHVGFGHAATYDHSGGTLTANVLQVATGSESLGTYTLSGTGVLKTSGTEVGMGGTGTFNQTGGTHTASFLGIGESATHSGNYRLGGTGNLSTGATRISEFGGTGGLTQTGGTHTTGHLVLGDGAHGFGWGVYDLRGGQLTVNGAVEVGLNGAMGDVYHSAGAATMQTLAVGSGPDGTSGGITLGNYELSGTGSLTVTASESVGANGGFGTFTQTGGTHVVKSTGPGAPSLQIGAQTASDGIFKLSGGSLTTDGTSAGVGGNGTLEQSGGTHTVNGALAVSPASGANGNYRLSGTGVLKTASATLGGNGGTSAFTQSGGSHTVTGQLALREDANSYALSGGSLSAASLQNDALFFQTGGTSTFGATSGVGGIWIYAGQLTAAHLRQGVLRVDETGKVTVQPNGGPGGVSRLNELRLDQSGTLDLTNNGLVIDHAGASPMTDVRAAIQNGRNGGSWTGPGLTSSTAAANPAGAGLGYAEAVDLFGSAGGVFMGQFADATTVLVRYTRLGDANLDGTVNFDDLLLLAKNYNGTPATLAPGWWSRGDFTYDGYVNFDDLLVLAKNYNAVLPAAPLPSATPAFDADMARAFAAAVPEPSMTTLAPIAACAAALTSRRRRRAAHA
jgi:hypothetical protein